MINEYFIIKRCKVLIFDNKIITYQLALVFSTTDKARYREIIKELLTSCNFHSTREDFENGRFEDYLQAGLNS